MNKLPIYDHYPSAEEWASVTNLSEAEKEQIFEFRHSHLESFAELIEGALFTTGAMRQIKKLGWDALKELP
jgi:hypothetical protein